MPAIPDPTPRRYPEMKPPKLTIKRPHTKPVPIGDLLPGQFFALFDTVGQERCEDGAAYILLGDESGPLVGLIPRLVALRVRDIQTYPEPTGGRDLRHFGQGTLVVKLVLEEVTFRELT